MRRAREGFTLAVSLLSAISLLNSTSGCGEPPHTPPRNVVLIILDTLRADRLGAERAGHSISPSLDALGQRSVVFEQAITNSTWTLPALSALFSGQYLTKKVQNDTLRVSMVEELRDAGFTTVAVNEGGYFARGFGMHRGFEKFMQLGRHQRGRKETGGFAEPAGEEGRAIAQTFRVAHEWLGERAVAEPFFLVVHTYETHIPYLRHTYTAEMDRGQLGDRFGIFSAGLVNQGVVEPTQSELDYVRALYDGGVTTADGYVGRLLDYLAELGIADETLIVVTSDHGEDLGDRTPLAPGSHGHNLHDELARVPLIVFDPTRPYPVNRVTAQVRTIDIMHTIFDLLGLATTTQSHGRSLVPLMLRDEEEDRPAFSRVQIADGTERRNMYSLRKGSRKLIVIPGPPTRPEETRVDLYDLESDPEEQQPIGNREPATRDAMLGELTALRNELAVDGLPVLKSNDGVVPSLRDQLRALGYVE
jgi:arylsulfatase A-like enzyme